MVESYSNLSFYDIKARAVSEWVNFEELLSIYNYLTKHRRTDFAIALRDEIENRLSELIHAKWDNPYSLEVLESELEEVGNPRLASLLTKLKERIDELFDEEHESFVWPTTIADPGVNSESDNYREPVSLLSICGYRTGEKARREGLDQTKRRQILRNIYEMRIPDDVYLQLSEAEDWGAPASSRRLRKMVYCSAESTKDMKRKRTGNYKTAIDQREADLLWLKVTIYDGRYDWEYANTDV